MKKLNKTVVILAFVMIASAALQGCNTFRGAGTDIKHGGEAIEDAADSD